MKECARCHTMTNDFQTNGSRLHSWCRNCVRQYNMNRYEQTRDYIFSLKDKCCICGYDKNPTALEFHHPDGDKEADVSRFARRPFCDNTKKLIDKEVEKCWIVCANCHREQHNPQYNK